MEDTDNHGSRYRSNEEGYLSFLFLLELVLDDHEVCSETNFEYNLFFLFIMLRRTRQRKHILQIPKQRAHLDQQIGF